MSPDTKGEQRLLDLFTAHRRVHHVADALDRLARTGRIGALSNTRRYASVMVSVGLALESSDLVFGTRGDWPVALGRGLDTRTLFAQALGLQGDPGLGRGMPGAVCDESIGVSLTDGNRASHLVHAAGFGHASRLRAGRGIGVGMMSPASLQNGEVHAALNFAAVYQAQVVFVARGLKGDDVSLADVSDAWGLWVIEVDGHDLEAVSQQMREACLRARKGKGPVILDARIEREAEDPSERLAAALRQLGHKPDELDRTFQAEVSDALVAVEGGHAVSHETLLDGVFSTRPWFLR